MKYSEKEKTEAYEYLKKYRGQKFACAIKSVSRSGMSRKMEFYAPNFDRIGYYIARIIDYPYNPDKGLSVSGCGMDMIFHVLSSLNYAMARLDGKYDELKEKGERIYDNYFIDASNYTYL